MRMNKLPIDFILLITSIIVLIALNAVVAN